MSEETKDTELEETQVIGDVEAREGGDAQAGAPEPEKGRKALSRNAKIGIAAGCAAALAAAVVGVCLWSNQPATLPADEPEGKALVAEAEEGEPQKVKVGYEGYEPDEGDTPVIVHVTGTTDGNRSVDYYHAVSGAQEEVELVPGGYSVEYLPVLKAGGSLLTAKDGAVSAVVEDGAIASTSKTNEKAAEDVTQDDLNNVLDAVKKAVEKGDDTLKGDVGKDVADKVAEAVKATGKVDESKVEEAKKDAETKASEPSSGIDAGQPAAPAGSAATTGRTGAARTKRLQASPPALPRQASLPATAAAANRSTCITGLRRPSSAGCRIRLPGMNSAQLALIFNVHVGSVLTTKLNGANTINHWASDKVILIAFKRLMAPCTMMRPGITRPSRPGTYAAGAGRLSSAAKSVVFDNETGAENVRLHDRRALRLRCNTGALFGAPVLCSWEGIKGINRIGLVRHFVSTLPFSASRKARPICSNPGMSAE